MSEKIEVTKTEMTKTEVTKTVEIDESTIEGRNAVIEAFRSGKTIDKIYIQDGIKDGPIQTVIREAKKSDAIRCSSWFSRKFNILDCKPFTRCQQKVISDVGLCPHITSRRVSYRSTLSYK